MAVIKFGYCTKSDRVGQTEWVIPDRTQDGDLLFPSVFLLFTTVFVYTWMVIN